MGEKERKKKGMRVRTRPVEIIRDAKKGTSFVKVPVGPEAKAYALAERENSMWGVQF